MSLPRLRSLSVILKIVTAILSAWGVVGSAALVLSGTGLLSSGTPILGIVALLVLLASSMAFVLSLGIADWMRALLRSTGAIVVVLVGVVFILMPLVNAFFALDIVARWFPGLHQSGAFSLSIYGLTLGYVLVASTLPLRWRSSVALLGAFLASLLAVAVIDAVLGTSLRRGWQGSTAVLDLILIGVYLPLLWVGAVLLQLWIRTMDAHVSSD